MSTQRFDRHLRPGLRSLALGSYGLVRPLRNSVADILAKLLRRARAAFDPLPKESSEHILGEHTVHTDPLHAPKSFWFNALQILYKKLGLTQDPSPRACKPPVLQPELAND